MTVAADEISAEPANDTSRWVASAAAMVRARLWVVAVAMAICLIGAVIYLRTAEYTYTAELRVAPAPTSSRESSSLGALTSLATLTGGTLESIPVTPFRLYVEGIFTREVAIRLARDPALMRRVFPREWDAREHRWRDPADIGAGVRKGLYRLLGVPVRAWSPPDAARLQAWIATAVTVNQTPKTPIVTISLSSPDKEFARKFLVTLHSTVDGWLRERTLERTRNNIGYLNSRLPAVTLADHRQALFATLSDQEQRQMMARNPAAYAAEPFGKATASQAPTSPRQLPVLVLALALGMFAGIVGALLVPRRPRHARKSSRHAT